MGKRVPQPAIQNQDSNRLGTSAQNRSTMSSEQKKVTTPYGTISYTPLSTERPGEIANLLSRYEDISKQGYSAPEYEARRAQAANLIKAQGQAAQRDLLTQQARQGVRGGAAVAQQQRASQQLAAQRAALDQNLMIEDIKNRQAMMGQFGSLLGGTISREDRLAAENLKRDIGAQVVGVGSGITQAQLDLAERERIQGQDMFNQYLEYLKKKVSDGSAEPSITIESGNNFSPIPLPGQEIDWENVWSGGLTPTNPHDSSGDNWG